MTDENEDEITLSFDDVKEPVFIKNTNILKPMWLHIKQKNIVNSDRSLKESIEDPLSPIKKITFALEEQGQYQCNKCGGILKDCLEKPTYCLHCERESSFVVITKPIFEDALWKLPIWEDLELDMLDCYQNLYDLIKKCVVFPEEMHYKLFTLWIISTYKTGCWETVPYLIFRGLISSGKTRALELGRELGYRLIHAVGISFPAMVRASHFFGAGILIDEIDNKIDHRTESGRDMLDFLKPGYRYGSKYIVADKEDQEKMKVYNNYGFKAFAGESGGYDNAMFSRSIVFHMEQDFPEVAELIYVRDDINKIKTMLLNYRYKTNNPPDLGEKFILKGRNREVFSAIIATGMHIGQKVDDVIEYAIAIEKEKEEEFRNTIEWDILTAIKNYSCNETLDDAPEEMKLSDITSAIGWDEMKRAGQKLGYMFKKLGLKTKRKRDGTTLLLNEAKNERKLKYLYKRYKI